MKTLLKPDFNSYIWTCSMLNSSKSHTAPETNRLFCKAHSPIKSANISSDVPFLFAFFAHKSFPVHQLHQCGFVFMSYLTIWHHLLYLLYLLFCVLDNPVSLFSVVSMCGPSADFLLRDSKVSIHLSIHSSLSPYSRILVFWSTCKIISFLSV